MSSITTDSASPSKQPAAKAAWVLLAIAWVCFLVPFPGLGLLGWVLNLVAFILAIVAMAKGGTMKGLFQLLSSLIVSPIIYFVGLAIFAAALTHGSYQDYKDRAQQTTQPATAHDTTPAANTQH